MTSSTVEVAALDARDVSVSFAVKRSALRRRARLQAVRSVSLQVAPTETVGLVGESGSGKSTLGRALMRLIPVDEGRVHLFGEDITDLSQRELRGARRRIQMVFQDPYSSLDPSATIADIVGEPLRVHDGLSARAAADEARRLLEQVGLRPNYVDRYPHEFSGGQRQRIAIARAIALSPDIVVLDEALSALDMSTQNQILGLLQRLRDDLGLAYVFISHDLSVVELLAHRTAVMYLGSIVEEGPTQRVHRSPQHPYTQALLSAVPVPDPTVQRERRRLILEGDLPDPLDPPAGCPFQSRCPVAVDVCATDKPAPMAVDGGGWAACHLLDSSSHSAAVP